MDALHATPRALWRDRYVKTPTVLQMEANECGAAALAIILGYHGRIVPLDVVRAECGVSRDGSKAANVLKAARKYGFEASGFRTEPEDINTLPLPMIIFWNFNHFVVLEGIKRKTAFINDPATGRRTVTADEFDSAFTGVVLTFEKSSTFRKGGERRSLLTSVRRRLNGFEIGVVYAFLASLLLVGPGLITPGIVTIFIDYILVQGKAGWLWPLLMALSSAALLSVALVWQKQSSLLRLETKILLNSSARFLWQVLKLPIGFFTQRFTGEIAGRFHINDRVAVLLSDDLAANCLNITMIAFYAVLMFQLDVVLTLACIVVSLMNLGALRFVSRRRGDANQRLLQEQGKLLGTTINGLQTIETLKASGSESDFFARWAGYQAKALNARQALAVSTVTLSAIPTLLAGLNTVLILSLGSIRVTDGYMTVGMLLAFQMLATNFSGPTKQLMDLGGKVQEAAADMSRLDDVFDNPVDPVFALGPAVGEEASNRAGIAKLSGRVKFNNVTFGYSKLEPPLIESFSLEIEPGARVALVGATGSGKSTIARLAAGLYAPWEGEILYDGQPLQRLPRAVVTGSIAHVDQDVLLFEGSVRDNLTLWDETTPENAVMQAAKDACIHDDIVARGEGYRSAVAEYGANFSAGQRQRLEIARALAAHPTILILDEATASLDVITENDINDNVKRRGCTCLIVAHRLSTIRDSDEIIVLDGGKIVQRGTHEQLGAIEGVYADLVRAR